MSGESTDTSTDLLETRYRAKRAQSMLNIELGISGQSATSGSSGGTVGGSPIIGAMPGSGGGGSSELPCFSGETPILQHDWVEAPMCEIEVGMYVKAPDDTGQLHDGRVINIWEHEVTEYLQLIFADRTTATTSEHKYRSKDGIYVPVGDLNETMHWADQWEVCPILDKKVITLDEPMMMYNLEVEFLNSYIANGDWVSNRKISPEDEL